MAMSKRHYVSIARAIRETRTEFSGEYPSAIIARGALASLTLKIADICGDDNSAFDRELFMRACTGEIVPFTCPLCGQRITDGLPCGCGART